MNSNSVQNSPLVIQHVSPSLYPYLGSFFNFLDVAVSYVLRGLVSYLVGLLQSIPTVALELFIFFAATFYFARDGEKIGVYVEYIIPENGSTFLRTFSGKRIWS
ncbi:MAG: hypothetical protein Q8N08_01705 [Methanobacteriaceae archaeon]|nr:hypothetical protein [Methanobacteriaceae archaeon]